jgi:3-hydroxybutyrate dehydrogenase
MRDMLRGRAAIVTGSTSGIGLGIARALAGEGCNVMLNGFGDRVAIEGTRAELARACGAKVEYHPADLTRPNEIEQLLRAAADAFGAIDILVNNAGIQHTSPVEQFPADKWDAILAINLSAAFHASRFALPAMRARGWGRIINIASAHGLVASVNKCAYVAAKHGLVGLTKVVALETAGSGVTCNAICPGWARTALVEAQIVARAEQQGVDVDQVARSILAEKQPSGQFVTVEQIGQLAVFLCSDAAAQITGTSLPIDGGWTAQ